MVDDATAVPSIISWICSVLKPSQSTEIDGTFKSRTNDSSHRAPSIAVALELPVTTFATSENLSNLTL